MPRKLPPPLLLLPLIAAVSGSQAAPGGAPAAPPERLAANRIWTGNGRGYAFRIAYFTAAETADPRWEAARLEMMKQGRFCFSGERMLRRDIRWYEPTAASGQRCAALVYTMECTVRNHIAPDRLDADRIGFLRQDPEPPIEAGCGEKDETRRPVPTAVALAQRMDVPNTEEMISPTAGCEPAKGSSADPVRVLPETRIRVRTLMSPGFATAVPFRADWYPRLPAVHILAAFSLAGRVLPRIRQSAIPDDGVNILVSQEFGMNRAGRPYCIRLTARQGRRRWEMRIERPGLVEERRQEVGVDRFDHSNDPRRYWYPGGDAISLAESLGAYLLRHAAPDVEFRRGWESAKPAGH